MKFFKYSLIAAVALSGVFTACSDDDDYVPGPQSPGVYFPAQAKTESVIELAPVQFEVTVNRYDVSGAADYTITSTTEAAGVFTVPSSVHFDADQNAATMQITCDAEAIGYGKRASVTLSFADGVAVSEYGNNTFTLTVAVAEPYKTLGTAQYIETCFSEMFDWESFGITNTTMLSLEIQESLLKPGYYRLVNLYGPLSKYFGFIWDDATGATDSYFYIDATNPDKVFIPAQATGMDFNEDYGNIMIMSDCEENLSGGYSNLYGKLADKVITFPKGSLLMYFPLYDGGKFFGVNSDGNAVLVLPGGIYGDYAANITYTGLFNDVTTGDYQAVCSVELGDDVQEAKVAMVLAKNADEAVQAVIDGSVESMSITPKGEAQQIFLPIDGDGTYFATVVTYANGSVQKSATARANITISAGGNGEADWEDYGSALIIDGWATARFTFQGGYTYEDILWEFPVQRNKKDPNLLRLVNLYTSDPEYNFLVYSGYNSNTAASHVVVDIHDRSAVSIEPQWGGLTWNPDKDPSYGGADWIIGNTMGDAVSQGYTVEEAKTLLKPEALDALSDGVLYISNSLFADPKSGEFGYAWRDKDNNGFYTAIQFSELTPASAPAKIGRRTVQRIHAIMGRATGKAVRKQMNSNHEIRLGVNSVSTKQL